MSHTLKYMVAGRYYVTNEVTWQPTTHVSFLFGQLLKANQFRVL